MSLSSYNPYDRYRHRSHQRFVGFIAAMVIMALAAFFGFFFGKELALRQNIVLTEQIKVIEQERDTLQNTITELRTEARTATLRYEELQKEYQNAAPEGPIGDLIKLVNKQIAEGMDPERITFLIRSDRPPRNCSDPASQRFILSTPTYTGAESKTSIADGAIIIKGSGSSARNEKGQPEAWYDPSKAVTLEFTTKEGVVKKKTGVMPLYHSAVIGAKEYRFTITDGARSFVKVTFDSCDYP